MLILWDIPQLTKPSNLGPRLNVKTVFPGIGTPLWNEMVVRLSYFYNGDQYTG